MIILGIDPGSRITGYGVIQLEKSKITYLASGVVRTTSLATADKLQQIFSGIREVMISYAPEEIAIEQVFLSRNFMSALKLGQARGVAIVAASQEGCPVAEYSARQIKSAVVGYGAAEKNQVQQMVKQLLQLSGIPQADAADALACAICHAHMRLGKRSR